MSKKSIKRIFVLGATGRQGNAVLRALLYQGFEVVAGTRHPQSPKAAHLYLMGVQVRIADMNDVENLTKAFQGCDGVFSVQNFWEGLPKKPLGFEGEIQQGQNVIKAAKNAGIKFLVQSSAAGADRQSGVKHFDSKYVIEKELAQSGLNHCVIRPVFFMEQFQTYGYPGFEIDYKNHTLKLSLPANRPLQMIAVEDIGKIVTQVFMEPRNWDKKAIDIASDEITPTEMTQLLEKHGIVMEYSYVEPTVIPSHQMRELAQWTQNIGYDVPVANLQKQFGRLTSFENWLDQQQVETA